MEACIEVGGGERVERVSRMVATQLGARNGVRRSEHNGDGWRCIPAAMEIRYEDGCLLRHRSKNGWMARGRW